MLDIIKKLRDETGVSVMACRKAIVEAEGDIDKAFKILQKEGIKMAEKKSERETNAGIIDAYVHATKKVGSLVEIKCETDFVARNEEFKKFAHDIAMQVSAMPVEGGADELLNQTFIKNPTATIRDYLNEITQKFGEKVEIGRFERFEI